MPTQPTRPAGSSHKLFFQGTVPAGEALAVFPKTQATYSSNTTAIAGVTFHEIRLLMANQENLASDEASLPTTAYDDTSPASAAPHDPVAGGGLTVDGLNVTELAITARTWCQNLKVSLQPQSAAAAAIVTSFASMRTQVVIDTLTGGLGTNTGLPVVVLFIEMANPATVNLDIRVEVQASDAR